MKIKKIKENIGIKINRKIIEFTHRYIFREEGKYIIEYSFQNYLTKSNRLFNDNYLLKDLKLFSFNA